MTEMINRGGQTKTRESLFWAALGVSSAWFLITSAVAAFGWAMVLKDGYINSPDAVFLLIALIALPTVVGWGIVRAIRLPTKTIGTRSVLRAITPLWTLAASVVLLGAFAVYKNWTMERIYRQQRTGSITFNCTENKPTGDPVDSGSIKLKITEVRRRKGFGDWTIRWPNKPPINAHSFEASTGSMGGSQGLIWHEVREHERIAYVSFSDLISDFGPSYLYIGLVSGPLTSVQAKLDAGAASYYDCKPDPKSWRE